MCFGLFSGRLRFPVQNDSGGGEKGGENKKNTHEKRPQMRKFGLWQENYQSKV